MLCSLAGDSAKDMSMKKDMPRVEATQEEEKDSPAPAPEPAEHNATKMIIQDINSFETGMARPPQATDDADTEDKGPASLGAPPDGANAELFNRTASGPSEAPDPTASDNPSAEGPGPDAEAPGPDAEAPGPDAEASGGVAAKAVASPVVDRRSSTGVHACRLHLNK